jgi:anti-sigma factor (TIGR02949 family)
VGAIGQPSSTRNLSPGPGVVPSVTSLSRVSCENALRRLDEYVDRALSPDELRQVEAHLAECLRCAEEFRFEASLIHGIRARLQRLAIPPSLLRSITLRLRAEVGAPRFDA